MLPREEIEGKVYDKMELSGLKEQARKPASKLSGGLKQRVSIMPALTNDPQIIMCDEPTGNLDSRNSQIVFDTFHELTHTFGQTSIAVTLDTDFAKNSDRTIELSDGKILKST